MMSRRSKGSKENLKVVRSRTRAKLSDLLSLDFFGKRAVACLELPAPEYATLSRASVPKLKSVAEIMLSSWSRLIEGELPPVKGCKWICPHGHEHRIEHIEIRDRMLMIAIAYYDAAVRQFIIRNDGKQGNPPGMHIRHIEAVSQKLDVSTESEFDLTTMKTARMLYFNGLFYAYFAGLLRRSDGPKGTTDVFERNLHSMLQKLHSLPFAPKSAVLQLAVRRMLQGLLDLSAEIYGEVAPRSPHHMPGVFSAIRLDELTSLAKRDKAAMQRYGSKQVEKVFEWQLALIVQSFGLTVVSTRSGQKTVDLLCISGSPDQCTFLLEAKTSKSAYTLPTSDARALREYVETVQSTLVNLPRLRFVLVVGGEPAKTLRNKIINLEAKVGVPVRFIAASELARLREGLPGPLPMGPFVDRLITYGQILDGAFVDSIVRAYVKEHSATSNFVETLLSIRGVTSHRLPWMDGDPACELGE
ncbi:MAG: hypothetical protein OEV49_13315 [candidate division Zixibacteria bacterium]|nr:hypothetical protein [candidate division Zixibacteria bacterium]MDH3939202.1 hypothetical protein [candidate division Zixibacteria bacterium]MDH4035765.1 hypothetical protein [candidate division Zixibacteria bacterium]